MYNPQKLTEYEKKDLHRLSVRWQQLFMEKLELLEKREKAILELHRIQSQIIEHTNELARLDGLRQEDFNHTQKKKKTDEAVADHIQS